MKLGVNIDHIATIRNARNDYYPSILRAFDVVKEHADIITIHLREDRRHIRDIDLANICKARGDKLINLEIGLNEEIFKIAIENRPNAVCIVPEKREEITTESGLDISKLHVKERLSSYIPHLKSCGIDVSLFLNCSDSYLVDILQLKPDNVEIHTGVVANLFENLLSLISMEANNFDDFVTELDYSFAKIFENINLPSPKIKDIFAQNINLLKIFFKDKREIDRSKIIMIDQDNLRSMISGEILKISQFTKSLNKNGIKVNVGHGLNFINILLLSGVDNIKECHIGHFLIAESCFMGLDRCLEVTKDILDSVFSNGLS
jgi:pyridoxine 5-phosphate synthase